MRESKIIQIMNASIIRGCQSGFCNIHCFVHFYLSCPSIPLYFDGQKKLKPLFCNLVHLLLHSSFSSFLSIYLSLTHTTFWPWVGLSKAKEREKEFLGNREPFSWSVKDFALGLKGPRGCLCFLVLEGVCSSNLTTSTSVHTLIRARINREVEGWPLVKGGRQHYEMLKKTTSSSQ